MSTGEIEGRAIPAEFIAYHVRGAPLEGFVSSTVIGYFTLWPLADIGSLNRQYDVAHCAPALIAFGSNGADEMLAFGQQNQVLMVPFIGMAIEDAIIVADSWRDFERILSL